MGLFGRLQDEMSAREVSPGLTMSDILTMPDSLSRLINWMMRQGQVDVAGVAGFMGEDEKNAYSTLSSLIGKGFIREIDLRGVTYYRVRLAPKKARKIPANLWKAIEDKRPE
ncbi:MAG: hypothetical protein WCF84_09955 [Anaerolineae bacterium]